MRATFKIILFARVNADGNQPVMLRATFLRQNKYYPLHRYCVPDQWDADAGRFRKNYHGWNKENDILRTYEQRAADTIREFEREAIRFTFEAFEAKVFADRSTAAMLAWQWIMQVSDELTDKGKMSTGVIYRTVASLVKEYAPKATLLDIDMIWLQRLERWLRKNRNVNDGGVSVYFRGIRAACNKAKKAKVMPKTWQPFEDFSLKHLKTAKAKRAITLDELYRIRDAVPATKVEALALNLFMFSFYMRGMNLADIAGLTTENIKDLRVLYARKKTGKKYNIKLNAKAAAILDRYKGFDYLFPIYNSTHVTEAQRFRRLHSFAQTMNLALQTIAGRVGLNPEGFTFYIARHTYATAHKMRGTSIEVIKELMGHSDYSTSEHYLSDFADRVLDEADEGLF